jgi:hypothetical protein
MTTSRLYPSSGEVVFASVCGQEEDTFATTLAVVVAPSVAALSIAGTVLGTGSPAWCAALATET